MLEKEVPYRSCQTILVEGGVHSSFAMNSKFSVLNLLAILHRILSFLALNFLIGPFLV